MACELPATANPGRPNGTASSLRTGNKKVRVNIALDAHRTVTVTGIGLDLNGLIEALTEASARARKAKQLRVQLPTFVQMLADQARTEGVVSS